MEFKNTPVRNSNPPSEVKSSVNKFYLVIYNIILVICWCMVLLKTLVFLTEYNSFIKLYNEVEYWLKVAQTAAILEIFHVLFGLVRSSLVVTIPQVMSRIVTLWIYLDMIGMKHESGAKESVGFPMLLFAWTITEIIRYTYYVNSLLDIVPSVLVWCRYTFFIILYPLGVTGELFCIYAALPIVRNLKILSISLPNTANISFNFEYVSYLMMLVYPMAFLRLYFYMFGQRRKYVGRKEKSL